MLKTEPDNMGIELDSIGLPRFTYHVRDKALGHVPVASQVQPVGSLAASANRLTKKRIVPRRGGGGVSEDWQSEAWDMYDEVGEQRFLATTLAGRVAQARLFVGKYNDDGDLEELTGDNDPNDYQSILDAFGDNMAGRTQMLYRMAINLFIAGEGYLVGVTQDAYDQKIDEESGRVDPTTMLLPGMNDGSAAEDKGYEGVDLDDIRWRFLSNDEVMFDQQGDKITLPLDDAGNEKYEFDADDVMIIRVWRPHPRRASDADSPTRSVLPVLRELVGLTMHISAQIDSRLAGAGVLLVPESAKRAFRESAGLDADDPSDPLTDALMEAMTTAIADRSSASALVPLVISAADETIDKFQHLTFDNQLDANGRDLRDEAIRRLALGQDAPPELLLGSGGMNHWGAWLVREDVVTTHIEPVLALICDALTTQYLWPVLGDDKKMDDREREKYVVWFDVSHMVVRPNRSDSAMKLYEAGALSEEAVREANGFDDTAAPEVDEQTTDRAVEMAMNLVSSAPSLLQNPGLPAIVKQVREMLAEGTSGAVENPVDNSGGSDTNTSPENGGSGPSEMPTPSESGDTPE